MATLMKKTDYNKVFVTSNHHFGSHLLIPQLQIYTKKQEDELIDKWNSVVGKNDMVIYNGSFGDYGGISYTKKYIDRLNGNITYINDYSGVYEWYRCAKIFNSVVDEFYLSDLDILISHDIHIDTSINIFGCSINKSHYSKYKNDHNLFCSRVELNDGYPVSIKQIMDKFKVSNI